MTVRHNVWIYTCVKNHRYFFVSLHFYYAWYLIFRGNKPLIHSFRKKNIKRILSEFWRLQSLMKKKIKHKICRNSNINGNRSKKQKKIKNSQNSYSNPNDRRSWEFSWNHINTSVFFEFFNVKIIKKMSMEHLVIVSSCL